MTVPSIRDYFSPKYPATRGQCVSRRGGSVLEMSHQEAALTMRARVTCAHNRCWQVSLSVGGWREVELELENRN
jgi:hypothetical protein